MALNPKPAKPVVPEAPQRGEEESAFVAKANPFIAFLSVLATYVDDGLTWMQGAYEETESSADFAATSSSAAIAAASSAASSASTATAASNQAASSAQSAGQTASDIAQDVVSRLQALTDYQGEWAAGSYEKGQSVDHAGSFYISNIDGNTSTPGIDSNWSIVEFGNLVAKPIITTPPDGTTDFYGLISASSFATFDNYTGTQNFVHWQLSQLPDFSVLDDEYQGGSNLDSWTPAFVDQQTTLYVRVRYGSDGHLSTWSETVSYTTPQVVVAKPSVTAPANGATDVPLNPVIVGSPYQIFGFSDTHASSDYRLATDAGMTNIVYQVIGSSDLTSHLVPDSQSLSATLYAQVRYNSTNYGSSEWSDPISFTTTAFAEIVSLAGSTGQSADGLGVIIDGDNPVVVGQALNDDYFAAKYDQTLSILAQVSSSRTNGRINAIDINASGDYVLVGSAGGTLSANIIRLSSSLARIDGEFFADGGSNSFNDVVAIPSGYVVCGVRNSARPWGMLLDVNLNRVSDITSNTISSSFESCAVDSSGNLYFAGNAGTDCFIIKTNSSMVLQQQVTLNVTAGLNTARINNIYIDASDNIYLAVDDNNNAANKFLVVKMNTSLSVVASARITGITGAAEEIIVKPNGIVTAISNAGDIVNLNQSLALLQNKKLSGDWNGIASNADSNIVMVGRNNSSASTGVNDTAIITIIGDLSVADGTTPGYDVTISTPVAASVSAGVTTNITSHVFLSTSVTGNPDNNAWPPSSLTETKTGY